MSGHPEGQDRLGGCATLPYGLPGWWHLHLQLDVNQITSQCQAKQRHEDSDEIDQESRGREPAGFQLVARPAVADQTGERKQHTPKNRARSEPDGNSHCSECVTFQLHELADGNGEAANRKTEYDDGNACANPGEKGALVGKVIAGAAGALTGSGLIIATRWLRHLTPRRFT